MTMAIETLLKYAQIHLGLDEFDTIYARNSLMDLFSLDDIEDVSFDERAIQKIAKMTVPDEVLAPFGEEALRREMAKEYELPNFFARVMGLVTPSPSIVRDKFLAILEDEGAKAACDYLYDLSIKNNYIQKTALSRNIYWKVPSTNEDKNFIEVTINLAKPEKTNEETAKLLTMKASGYPKCMLCCENLGYPGGAKQGARQNLRYIPLTLAGEEWYLQYSPFIYYDEHCIVFSKTHTPMKTDSTNVQKLIDFLDVFPNYFVGSNAGLPIVGGSILNHEHFQAGKHLMPLHFAPDLEVYDIKEFISVRITKVDWYNSVLRLASSDRAQLEKCAARVIDTWETYTDESVDIISKTDKTHNAVTPIARKTEEGYILDIILRNNRCNKEHPDGIFHAHSCYHNIKKESIGLIEAMGMFILPGRLKRETAELVLYLSGKKRFDEAEFAGSKEAVHLNMLKGLLERYGTKNTLERANELIINEINFVCRNILRNTAVFKDDDMGKRAWARFIQATFKA